MNFVLIKDVLKMVLHSALPVPPWVKTFEVHCIYEYLNMVKKFNGILFESKHNAWFTFVSSLQRT